MAKTRERKKARGRKRTAFVPRMVLTGTFVALVPMCVAGCGGMSVAADAFGVADVAFPRDAGRDGVGVADIAFSVARDAFSVADIGFRPDSMDAFGVADIGFPADAMDAPPDRGFSVADVGFRPETGDSG